MISELTNRLQKKWMLICLIEKYYETDSAGGCVHIVLDDGNYGNRFIQNCLEYSLEQNDFWGETISRLLLEFDEKDQEQIIERPWEITEQVLY